MKNSRVAIAFLGVALLVSVPSAEADGFEYSLTPYLWATGFDGSVALGTIAADLDVGFSDLFDNLEMAVPIHFEAKGAVWTLIAEVNFAGIGQDFGTLAGKADVDLLIAELISAWQWKESVELFFGARYTDVELGLDFAGPVPPDVKASQEWVDPLVGLRYAGQLNRRGTWHSSFRVDVGGFGLGSDLTWNVRTGIGYDFSDSVGLWVSYHWLDTDYDDAGFVYDVLQQGPEIGLRFSF